MLKLNPPFRSHLVFLLLACPILTLSPQSYGETSGYSFDSSCESVQSCSVSWIEEKIPSMGQGERNRLLDQLLSDIKKPDNQSNLELLEKADFLGESLRRVLESAQEESWLIWKANELQANGLMGILKRPPSEKFSELPNLIRAISRLRSESGRSEVFDFWSQLISQLVDQGISSSKLVSLFEAFRLDCETHSQETWNPGWVVDKSRAGFDSVVRELFKKRRRDLSDVELINWFNETRLNQTRFDILAAEREFITLEGDSISEIELLQRIGFLKNAAAASSQFETWVGDQALQAIQIASINLIKRESTSPERKLELFKNLDRNHSVELIWHLTQASMFLKDPAKMKIKLDLFWTLHRHYEKASEIDASWIDADRLARNGYDMTGKKYLSHVMDSRSIFIFERIQNEEVRFRVLQHWAKTVENENAENLEDYFDIFRAAKIMVKNNSDYVQWQAQRGLELTAASILRGDLVSLESKLNYLRTIEDDRIISSVFNILRYRIDELSDLPGLKRFQEFFSESLAYLKTRKRTKDFVFSALLTAMNSLSFRFQKIGNWQEGLYELKFNCSAYSACRNISLPTRLALYHSMGGDGWVGSFSNPDKKTSLFSVIHLEQSRGGLAFDGISKNMTPMVQFGVLWDYTTKRFKGSILNAEWGNEWLSFEAAPVKILDELLTNSSDINSIESIAGRFDVRVGSFFGKFQVKEWPVDEQNPWVGLLQLNGAPKVNFQAGKLHQELSWMEWMARLPQDRRIKWYLKRSPLAVDSVEKWTGFGIALETGEVIAPIEMNKVN